MIRTGENILLKIASDLQLIPTNLKEFTLVDFGAGDGIVLKRLGHLFAQTIGIDIEPQDESVIKMDMINYKFNDVHTVLYMYEPLHDMADSYEAIQIYYKVLDNFNEITCSKILVSYMSDIGVIREWCRNNNFQKCYSSSSYHIFKRFIEVES